jgi:D-alanyl-D-alanine carboxypeptidase
MRSGLFDYLNDGDKTVEKRLLAGDLTYRWSPLELVAIATRHEPHFAPNADWSYCNTCYVLLGQIIEGATGHRLGDELRERVFAPAGLRATSFDTEPRIAGSHAHGYEQLGSGTLTDVGVISPSYAGAAGAIVSTAGDLARFHRELYRGHLLRPELLNAMRTVGPMKAQYRGYGYGMGLLKQPMGCGSGYGHGGAIAGFLADAYSSRDAGRQAVVLANIGEDSISDRAAGALQNVLRSAYCAGR